MCLSTNQNIVPSNFSYHHYYMWLCISSDMLAPILNYFELLLFSILELFTCLCLFQTSQSLSFFKNLHLSSPSYIVVQIQQARCSNVYNYWIIAFSGQQITLFHNISSQLYSYLHHLIQLLLQLFTELSAFLYFKICQFFSTINIALPSLLLFLPLFQPPEIPKVWAIDGLLDANIQMYMFGNLSLFCLAIYDEGYW